MPARKPRRRSITPVAGVAALITCAAVIAGCGGSDEDTDAGATPNLGPDQQLQHLTCADWNGADGATRDEIVRRLTEILGGQITGRGASGSGSVLSPEQADAVFDGQCGPSYARGFVLYKLYGLASGFSGGSP